MWFYVFDDKKSGFAWICVDLHGFAFRIHPWLNYISDPSLPSIDLGIEEDRNMLWGKTKAAFKYVYENYR